MLFLISCSHKLKEGTVISKKYEPARTWTQSMPIVISTGKVVSVIMTPMVMYDGPDFILLVEGENKKSEIVREKFYVNDKIYNAVSNGSYIMFSKKTMERKDKIKKRKKIIKSE